MKAAISKEQSMELRKWMEKQRVPKSTVELLLNSRNAGNTYKAFRQKKQITTSDGWILNFGANWARVLEKPTAPPSTSTSAPSSRPQAALNTNESASTQNAPEDDPDASTRVKSIGEDFLSRTFMGLAEKTKKTASRRR